MIDKYISTSSAWNVLCRAVQVCVILSVAVSSAPAQTSPHGKLAFQCEECHSASSWKEMTYPSKFQHAKTGFPLKGQHELVRCTECHTTLKFAVTGKICADCHDDVHRSELGRTCDRCHSPDSWLVPDMVQRHSRTRFALVGAHATANCQACHKNQQQNEFINIRTDCFGCHQTDFEATRSPNHRMGGYSTDCLSCHTMTSWHSTSFDHNKTAFKLTGAHAATACNECHKNNVFKGTSMVCITCHQPQFTAALNPKHTGFPTDCASCHATTAWHPASFDHNATAFKLTGAHQSVACDQCHKNGVYAGTPTQCVNCHQQQFTAALNPKHTGFPTDCASCHATTAWQPASFDHNTTAFKLAGAHQAVACDQCHKNNVFAGTPTLCIGCHQTDYQNAASPKHSPGFSTDCTTCHTVTAWQPASFDHSKTNFALTGAHVTTPCASCHGTGVYAGTPNTCGNSSCHLAKYNATTNPAHAGAGFPTDCQTCHSTTAWVPSSFNHTTFFPISAGARHSPGRWTVCADCHTVSTNFKLFSCIDCHEHQPKSKVDSQHGGRSGYSYVSTACYNCHPRGTAN